MKTYRGRTIALPEEGYQFFKALARGKAKDEFLLLRDNGKPWKTAYLSEIFRPLKRRLGIPDSFVFHNIVTHTHHFCCRPERLRSWWLVSLATSTCILL